MGIFSGKNRFKMDALRIKERGNKNTPTNFAESAVEFMKGMPGYYPQDHEAGHPSEREERRPDIGSVTEDDIINKQVVKRDGGEYITGQVKVDGGSRPDTGGSYGKVYDKFETNEMGQKINSTTGAVYNSVEEFIEDAKKSDKKEGYGEQIYDVDREIDYSKNWSSSFWSNYNPGVVQQMRKRDPNYITSNSLNVMRHIIKDNAIRDDDGRRRGSRISTLFAGLKQAGLVDNDSHDWKSLGMKKSARVLSRILDELILKDPDAAEQIYRDMELPTRKGSGNKISYNKSGSDTGYRYTSD